MIPKLRIDNKSIQENWKEHPESWDEIKERCARVQLHPDNIPVYSCGDEWVKLGVFQKYKKVVQWGVEYGYCDTEEVLQKYLKSYVDSDKKYFVEVGLMDMDYEKYYKNGTYINKDAIRTGEDYYDYIDKHPEEEDLQQYEGNWIKFCISEIE